MKLNRSLCFVFLLITFFTSVKAQYYMGGDIRPMIALNDGDVLQLMNVKKINIVYDYSNMSVGAFRKEADYLKKKKEDYSEKDEEKARRFEEGWFNARKERYEPAFEAVFAKYLLKIGIDAQNYSRDGEITLKVETVATEIGYNAGVAARPSFIDAECTFTDKNGKLIAKYFIKNAVGSSAYGVGFDVGSRLRESYAKAGKMLAKDLGKRIKKARKNRA